MGSATGEPHVNELQELLSLWHKHPKLGSNQLVQEEEDLSRGPVACPCYRVCL